jgi:8-oxo-dGTP pyrophosphatase MutT (NUDIX family)
MVENVVYANLNVISEDGGAMTKTIHDSETLAEGQQVIVARTLIHHNFNGVEKVFLPKRADTKKFMPSVYELPGGHVEFGEDIVEGLKREIMEEFGEAIRVGDPFAAFTYENKVKAAHSVEVVYFAQFEGSIDDIEVHPEDHSGYVWLGADELSRMLDDVKTENDEEYKIIQKAFDLLAGKSPRF